LDLKVLRLDIDGIGRSLLSKEMYGWFFTSIYAVYSGLATPAGIYAVYVLLYIKRFGG